MATDVTWSTRQQLGQCCYSGCDDERLPDRDYCRLHWLASMDRKRYWWTYRRHTRRPKQLCLVFESR